MKADDMPAGKMCPKCGNYTFRTTLTGRKCSRCDYTMELPPGSGKGKKCSNCGKFQVINSKCHNCGAIYY